MRFSPFDLLINFRLARSGSIRCIRILFSFFLTYCSICDRTFILLESHLFFMLFIALRKPEKIVTLGIFEFIIIFMTWIGRTKIYEQLAPTDIGKNEKEKKCFFFANCLNTILKPKKMRVYFIFFPVISRLLFINFYTTKLIKPLNSDCVLHIYTLYATICSLK